MNKSIGELIDNFIKIEGEESNNQINKKIIEEFLTNNINKKSFSEKLSLYDDKTYEILITTPNRGDYEIKYGKDEKIKIIIENLSKEYIANLLFKLLEQLEKDSHQDKIVLNSDTRENFPYNEILNKIENKTNFKMKSLKIISTEKIQPEDFQKIFSSYSFRYMYSSDNVIVVNEDIKDIYKIFDIRVKKKLKLSLKKIKEIIEEYNFELVNFYKLGIESKDPYIQYLSYYHILEYHYDNIFKILIKKELDKLSNNISEEAVVEINKITKRRNGKNPLEQILREYITNTKDIKIRVKEISEDNNILEYYKQSEVKIDWDTNKDIDDGNNIDKILKSLTNRIYKKRNFLVHSTELAEEEQDNFYKPWDKEHEELLRKEIPLIRAIAELVIKKTSINLD